MNFSNCKYVWGYARPKTVGLCDLLGMYLLRIMAIRVAEFSKLEIFLSKNQHTQRKLLNFENWVNGEVSKSAKI